MSGRAAARRVSDTPPISQGAYQIGEDQARSWITFGVVLLSHPLGRLADASVLQSWVLQRQLGFSMTRA